MGNFRVRNVFNSEPVNQRSTTNGLRGWLLGPNGRINPTPQWYVGAHAGWFWANDNNDRCYDPVGEELASPTATGARELVRRHRHRQDVDEHFGVGVRYDYFHANAGHYANPDTGERITGLKRSTGIVSLVGEYRSESRFAIWTSGRPYDARMTCLTANYRRDHAD